MPGGQAERELWWGSKVVKSESESAGFGEGKNSQGDRVVRPCI